MLARAAFLVFWLAGACVARYDPLSVCGDWMIGGYKLVLSPLQGQNLCNFSPTCSQFTKAAIRTQGFLPGVLIGADRLMRCNTFAWSYYDTYYTGPVIDGRMPDRVENHVAWRSRTDEPGLVVAAQSEQLGTRSETSDVWLRQPLSDSAVMSRRLPASTAPAPPGPSLSFADFLYSSGEYSQAAAEYLRVRFTAGSTMLSGYAGLMAGESYLRAEDFSGARRAFMDLRATPVLEFSRYGVARTLFAVAEYPEARAALDSVVSAPLAQQARALAGWTLFKQHRFAEGASALSALQSALPAQHLATMDGRDIRRRSRLASSLLSTIIPGAGQLYSGRAGDGAYSFLTVVGTGLVTWWYAADLPHRDRTRVKVSIFGVITALFYAGNVYGANVAARDYNLFQERRYVQRADSLFSLLPLEPDYRPLLDSVSPRSDTGK